jgi:hypothetical protein
MIDNRRATYHKMQNQSGNQKEALVKKLSFTIFSLALVYALLAPAYTKEDAQNATLGILEQNGYGVKVDQYGAFIAEKDVDGFIVQLTVRLTQKGTQNEFVVTTTSRLPDLSKYNPEQTKLANKTSKEQVKVMDFLIKKHFKYFKALEKYVKSHYGLTPEVIEAMKTQDLALGLTFDQASFILEEKYYRYESWQTISTLLTGLANVLDAAGGGSGNKYQYAEFDNKVHCKKAIVPDENDPAIKATVAYYYYRDPKSNQSFWLNGQYVDVKNYNAESGETPLLRLYFQDNRLIKWEELQEFIVK